MNTCIKLSFEAEPLNEKLCSELFTKYVKFIPYSFTKGVHTYPWNETKHLKLINGETGKNRIMIDDREGSLFYDGLTSGTKNPHRSILIDQPIDIFSPDNYDMASIITKAGFVSAYIYHQQYVYVQSQTFENNLIDKNLPQDLLDTIKNTPFELGVFDDKHYDVRFNPGRQLLIGYTWIMAAWKMWFGQPFFKLVAKEKIMAFPDAVEIKETNGGTIFVKLYDRIEESHLKENMLRQWKWREWIDMDSLEKRYQ